MKTIRRKVVRRRTAKREAAPAKRLIPRRPLLTPDERRLRTACRAATYRAISRGEIVNPRRCQRCGVEIQMIEAHHADYTKPLEIEWLCRECHEPHRQILIREYTAVMRSRQPEPGVRKTLAAFSRKHICVPCKSGDHVGCNGDASRCWCSCRSVSATSRH